jgi:hypothetical protein
MYARKTLLQIIGLTFIIWLLTACGSAPTAPAAIDFTGHWEDPSSAFSLDLSQVGEQVQGSHTVVAQQGNKIDSLDNSIEGNINGHLANIKFQSSFSANSGEAQITFIDQNTIFWKVTTPPDGEYYLPAQATLIKKAAAPIILASAIPIWKKRSGNSFLKASIFKEPVKSAHKATT